MACVAGQSETRPAGGAHVHRRPPYPGTHAVRRTGVTSAEGGSDMPEQETTLADGLCTAWHRFVDVLVPHRPALHGYCRRLAGNVWDAEDLVQDSLLRAFGQWGVTAPPIRDLRAYLLRTATNVWIDWQRRRATE